MSSENLEVLKGIVKTITFKNEENGYTIAKIEVEGKKTPAAVIGYVKLLSEGESVVFRGIWVNDPKHGRQFKFQSYESVLPSSIEGVKRFLASKYMKGIGEVLSARIVEAFGKDTIKVLDETPELLYKVDGIVKKKADAVLAGWATHKKIREVMIFLQSHGISETYATKIYEQYGRDTIDRLRANPYRLIKDIRGIGFIKADGIAQKLGIPKDSPERIKAGILYCLDTFAEKGHVYAPLTELVENVASALDVEASSVLENIKRMASKGDIQADEEKVYRADLAECENKVSQMIKIIMSGESSKRYPPKPEIMKMIEEIEKERGIAFAPLQKEAIIGAAVSNIFVLTGGPGTGKTTTVRGIIDILRRLKISVLLCAPTGRAAKRLSETTGMEAKTIHRMLEYNPHKGKFTKNEGDPLQAEAVIVDEASMVDIILMRDMLKAVTAYMKLIIVGDADQLPSIGPGSVLRDIIDSGTVPTVCLSEIFRQAGESGIVMSAHLINSGKMPLTDNDKNGNFFFIRKTDPVEITKSIIDMVYGRLPARYGFDPIDEIQVLSPMHKSETGVMNLNLLLQKKLNPPRASLAEVRKGDWTFRTGDKVMQIRNNYDKAVYNGDIGRIKYINVKDSTLIVQYDVPVEYKFSELDDIEPAYAISVHKSQGSEFRCVIMPLSTQHFIMLKRNLVYTSVTRARELAVIIGDPKALAIAVKNDTISERYSSLKEKLMLKENDR